MVEGSKYGNLNLLFSESKRSICKKNVIWLLLKRVSSTVPISASFKISMSRAIIDNFFVALSFGKLT